MYPPILESVTIIYSHVFPFELSDFIWMHNGVKTNILRVNEILCTYYNHSITQINSFNGYQNLGFSDIVIMNPAQNMPISPYSKTNNLGSLNSYIIVDYYSVKELFSAIQSFLFLGNINIEQKCVVSKKTCVTNSDCPDFDYCDIHYPYQYFRMKNLKMNIGM